MLPLAANGGTDVRHTAARMCIAREFLATLLAVQCGGRVRAVRVGGIVTLKMMKSRVRSGL
jgi:hypothetical protein